MSPLKLGLAAALHGSGGFRLARWANRQRLLVLTYHGVLPAGHAVDPYLARNVVRTDQFDWQMAYLRRHFRCLTLGHALRALAAGRLPQRSAVVTFDDGFRNNFTCAYPILQQHGVPATIFLTTGFVGRGPSLLWTERVGRQIRALRGRASIDVRIDGDAVVLPTATPEARERSARWLLGHLKALDAGARDRTVDRLERDLPSPPLTGAERDRYDFLDWRDVEEMAASGLIEFGSHTVTHPILSSLTDDARREEIVASKRAIEAALDRPCDLFSYPNGTEADFGEHDRRALADAGYTGAASQIPGLNDPGTDPFALRRVNIGRGHGRLLFVAQVSGLWPRVADLAGRLRPARQPLPAWRPSSVARP